jgi:hypothetical protein
MLKNRIASETVHFVPVIVPFCTLTVFVIGVADSVAEGLRSSNKQDESRVEYAIISSQLDRVTFVQRIMLRR